MKHSKIKNINSSDWLWLVTLLTLLIPNAALAITENMPILAAVTNIFLPAGIYGLLLCVTPKVGRQVWWLFIFIFLAAFQIVLLDLYGRSVIAVDMFLNVVTTNSTEVGELLGNMLPIISVVCLLYIPVLTWSCIAITRHKTMSSRFVTMARKASLSSTIVGTFALVTCLSGGVPGYAPYRDLYPFNALYNLGLAIDRTIKVNNYHLTSAGFTYHASRNEKNDSIREICIIVVGETSRARDWQLYGYPRQTTPRLSKRMGNGELVAFDKALSQSNTTHKSVPMLLSPVTALDFDKKIYRTRSLITAFKEAGFNTVFLSNQRHNGSFIDFFGNEADECRFIKEDNHSNLSTEDRDLLPIISDIIKGGQPRLLVVVHTYGSHFNYRERYTGTEARFLPDDAPEAEARYREQLLNAYDNTILSTDILLDSIIATVEQSEAIGSVIYTSDHGEDIFDDSRELFLHASPCPSFNQVHVPMFVWLSHNYRQYHPDVMDNLKRNRHRHCSPSESFCHTALELGGILTPLRNDTLSLASSLFKDRPWIYLNDHNKAVPLKTGAGFTDEDTAQLLKLDSHQ